MIHASVASHESVVIYFLISSLKHLDIIAGNIQNAYLNAPTKEKYFFCVGYGYNSDEGKIVLIIVALCGLNASALDRRNHLSDILGNYVGFRSSLEYPYV